MFNKTRRKIVFTVVISLLVLMAVTLATIFVSNRIALIRENESMLKMYAEQYSLEEQPSDMPENGKPDDRPGFSGEKFNQRGRNEPRFQLSTFYSVAYSGSGEVLAIRSGNNTLQSEEKLLETASSILKSIFVFIC